VPRDEDAEVLILESGYATRTLCLRALSQAQAAGRTVRVIPDPRAEALRRQLCRLLMIQQCRLLLAQEPRDPWLDDPEVDADF
jgi:hypothetical protein